MVGAGLLLAAAVVYGQFGPAGTDGSGGAGAGSPTVSSPGASTTPASVRVTTTSPSRPALGPLVAVVGVSDGDTIRVRVGGATERVRVIGIDAPELSPRECYAQQAASRMQSLVQGTSVRLTADPTQADRDRYGRLLRHVWLTDGRSVAGLLIAGGYGVELTYAKPYAGQATYRAAEASAKAAHLGIWSSGCAVPLVKPTVPLLAKPTVVAKPTSCLIKGNINGSGEKIYHLPGDRYYDVTKITESKGERWFCSESDAVNAGWRHAKV